MRRAARRRSRSTLKSVSCMLSQNRRSDSTLPNKHDEPASFNLELHPSHKIGTSAVRGEHREHQGLCNRSALRNLAPPGRTYISLGSNSTELAEATRHVRNTPHTDHKFNTSVSVAISFGLWTCSGSRRRERESSTPSRLSSRPRGSRWHALCSRQDWS